MREVAKPLKETFLQGTKEEEQQMHEFWHKQCLNEEHIKIKPCLCLKAPRRVGIRPQRRCVILAALLEKGNSPLKGSENRPCAENPLGYRMALITIRERNVTSAFKNLCTRKVPDTNNPFKTALGAPGLYIRWQSSTKLPPNAKTIPTNCHIVGVMQIHTVQDNVAVIIK